MRVLKIAGFALALTVAAWAGRQAEAGHYWVSGYAPYAPVAPVYYPAAPVVTTYYAPYAPAYAAPVAPVGYVGAPVVYPAPVIAPAYQRVTVRPYRGVVRVRNYGWGW
ncbi:hypothetical protein [Planctomicrobium sp. SH664]|uniref:hypothetical protein n=1 Tax=Planctomicrobium sp. SH664 TaxID=3448125 RepID=UPI003F5B7E27